MKTRIMRRAAFALSFTCCLALAGVVHAQAPAAAAPAAAAQAPAAAPVPITDADIKNAPTAQGESKVILMANPEVTYEVVVGVLDACRGKLTPKPDPEHPGKSIEAYERFGDVILSAGVN